MPTLKEQLRQIALFHGVSDADLERLAAHARLEFHTPGEVIFHEGEPADTFFLVMEGCVGIYYGGDGQPVHRLGHLRSGEFFGEMGLLNEAPRFASARIQEPSRLLRVDREGLLELMSRHPQIELQLRNVMIRRHNANVSLALDQGRRRDVRVQVHRPVWLIFDDGSRHRVMLDNLSSGGICLLEVPAPWKAGQTVRFRLGAAGVKELLRLNARVAWRRGQGAGLVFLDPAEDHEERLGRVLTALLGARPEKEPGAGAE